MKFLQIVKRDLLFYRRNNLATLLLAMVCCAVLTGALLVGDSVRYSLLRLSQMRLGKVQFVCSTGEGYFRRELADELANGSGSVVAPVLALKGILESPDGTVRVNQLTIYGIDETFWQLASGRPVMDLSADQILPNQSLADRLGGYTGQLLLRLGTDTVLSQDLIFSTEGADSRAWNVQVGTGVSDDLLGRFSLQAQQRLPLNVFVPIEWLADKAQVTGKANMLLVGHDGSGKTGPKEYDRLLRQFAILSDYGLEIRDIKEQNVIELRSPDIFLEKAVTETAIAIGANASGIFTYFVNELSSGEKSVPYSTVAAVDTAYLSGLAKDQIAVNEWLAAALKVGVGDTVRIRYFKITPTRELIEQSSEFTVGRVVPMMGPFADSTLMPELPGLSDADNCRDWEPGIPLDLDKISRRDEAYWDRYGGTPKAYISLDAADDIWANRFGNRTAVRWPDQSNSQDQIRSALLENIDPAQVGFYFQDVRATAEKSASGSTDFAGLFAGLSMFLIFSAAILLALIFVFYVESRSDQVGLLLAVGWNWLRIFTLFMVEGSILAMAGCVLGAAGSVFYSWLLISLLNVTFWAKALADLQLVFHAEVMTAVLGIFVSLLICVFSIQLALFRRIRKSVHQLLTRTFENYLSAGKKISRFFLWLGLTCLAAAILLPWQSKLEQSQTGAFFMTGVLLLLGLFFLSADGLTWLRSKSASFAQNLPLLALKNIPRRSGRSLAVLVTLACGVFMVIGVGANYKDVGADAQHRDSGTGGFAFIAETTLPMTTFPTLPQPTQRGISPISAEAVVGFRVYQQDDASCLNLNRAVQPTLLGVQPQRLAEKKAFAFQKTIDGDVSGWELLDQDMPDGAIGAIGDYATVVWGLKKNLSDTIPYRDENGNVFQLQIVGILKESVLQGRLLVSEKQFVRHFPSIDGRRLFLIEADWNNLDTQAAQLTRAHRDFGMELVETATVLAQYHEVENTYMAIFMVLGGLGLVLGSAGLGLVLILNVLDRKAEIAMMQAVGFRKPAVTGMLFIEHGLLLLGGLLAGLVPALWAVIPIIRTRGGDFPYAIIICMVIAMLASGAVWVRIAISGILKMKFLETLRNQ